MFCWKHRLRYARNERITEKKLTGRRRRQPPSFMDTHADVEWKSFSLTHVRYPSGMSPSIILADVWHKRSFWLAGDVIGFALAFISLAPFAIIVAFVTLIAFKKELDTVMFLLGQLTNEILNMVLKNVIREQRPAVTATHTPKSFGMPSSHSQFQSFFTVFAILFIVFRMKHKPDYFRFPIITALILSWFAVLYSRWVRRSRSCGIPISNICFLQNLPDVPYVATGRRGRYGRNLLCMPLLSPGLQLHRTSSLQHNPFTVRISHSDWKWI